MAYTLEDFKSFNPTGIGIAASSHKDLIKQAGLDPKVYGIAQLAPDYDLDMFAELGEAIIDKKLVPKVFGAYGK